jgi:molecular chaperone HscB
MSNIIEFITTSGAVPTGLHCWLCQKPTSLRALFCHHCGTIQPVRQLDHFMRLGMERRVDIDMDLLEKQYMAFRRTLDPQRFAIRGVGERGHAAKQLEALDEAYETLRDPVRRGRYWLVLNEHEFEQKKELPVRVAELRDELDAAGEAAQCDSIAQRAGQAMEEGIMNLMQALRSQNWQQANSMLVELDGLEGILRNIRDRRAELASASGEGGGIRAET